VSKKIKALILNIFTMMANVFIHRDNNVILIGAWMGTKFADNSRFLFQYLVSIQDIYGYKVIWVTRDSNVYKSLSAMGYSVFMCGSKSSLYWHLKAGIHIICDVATPFDGFKPDIDTNYSWGARKIQLWHGNGIKAVGKSTNQYIRISEENTIRNKIKNIYINLSFLRRITTNGGWSDGYYKLLCKSDMDFILFKKKFGVEPSSCIDASYPRVCHVIRYLEGEEKIINKIKSYKKSVLYLPTFRKSGTSFQTPLTNTHLREWLVDSGTLWIEKAHSASKRKDEHIEYENVLYLDSDFDVNILYREIDLIVTDYSSVMLDALFYYKPVVYYVPDFDEFIKNDVGLLMPFDEIIVGPKVMDIDELADCIEQQINTYSVDSHYTEMRNMFWSHPDWGYKEIWQAILSALNLE